MSDERHPFFFTWTQQRGVHALHLTGGKGAYFETSNEGSYLDMGSLIYQVNAGHGHAAIVEAVREQASRLCVSVPGAVYPEKTRLAEKLIEHAPEGFGRVFFTLGGSDANENAIKIARLYTKRYKIIARYQSYHGATMGAVSLSGDWRRPAVEPGLVGVVHVADWDWIRTRTDGAPPSLIPETIVHEDPRTVAAVFVEPVVGANGVLIPPPGYMRALRDACDAHGVLLVFDEVLTGFGRTGRWFAFEHFDGVVPDMITCGKAITSGYGVLGAVLVRETIAQRFDTEVLAAGLTHYAHPLGVAAALATLEAYEQEGLVDRAASLEAALRDGLEALRAKSPPLARAITDVRVIGLLAGVELHGTPANWTRLKEALVEARVHAHVLPRSRVLVLAPPLCITEEELTRGLALVGGALEEAFA